MQKNVYIRNISRGIYMNLLFDSSEIIERFSKDSKSVRCSIIVGKQTFPFQRFHRTLKSHHSKAENMIDVITFLIKLNQRVPFLYNYSVFPLKINVTKTGTFFVYNVFPLKINFTKTGTFFVYSVFPLKINVTKTATFFVYSVFPYK